MAYNQKTLQFFGPNAHFNLQISNATSKSNQSTVFTSLFSKEPMHVHETRGLSCNKSRSQQVSYRKYIYIFVFNHKGVSSNGL